MARHILHVDCNAFYASVEQQRRPELRGKPVAVCGSQEDRHGIVLTASYPAKRVGVKTGMAIWQARQRCPDLAVLPPDMGEYIRISRLARDIYERFTDQVEPFGLDEAWLDITGSVGLFGTPMEIAKQIRDLVEFELGITVSIGVSDNKVTAKLGSDYRKPDAITRIEQDNYQEIVYPLPVEDLLYVGPATSRKLRGIGIDTIGRLAQCPVDVLSRRLGKMGIREPIFKGAGDIICCLDESSSTKGEPAAWGKAVALTLLEIAADGGRKFALVHFSGSDSIQTDLFLPGSYTAADKMAAAETFLGGGTNFQMPLDEALRLMEENGFENADMVFITDGECALSDEYAALLGAEQVSRRFTVTGVLLDKGKPAMDFSLKPFCQVIYRTSELVGDEIVQKLVDQRV